MTYLQFLLLALWVARYLAAQVSTGSVIGLINDSTGAVVSEASVRVINEDTSAERVLKTDGTGNFSPTSLPPVRYRVEASLAGFQPQSKVGLILSLDQRLTVNFALNPGEQKQSVEVVARAEQLVQAATSSLG